MSCDFNRLLKTLPFDEFKERIDAARETMDENAFEQLLFNALKIKSLAHFNHLTEWACDNGLFQRLTPRADLGWEALKTQDSGLVKAALAYIQKHPFKAPELN